MGYSTISGFAGVANSLPFNYTMSSHILPTSNAAYDIGSAEYKIRHLFLSDNSLWIGDDHKLSVDNNKVGFKKRKKKNNQNKIPRNALRLIDPAFGGDNSRIPTGKTAENLTIDEYDQIIKTHSDPSLSINDNQYYDEQGFTITDPQFNHLTAVKVYDDNFEDYSSHVIPALIKKIDYANKTGQETVTIWGDGSPSREFLYVDQAAQAIVKSININTGSSPINIGSGEEIRITDLVNKLIEKMNFTGFIKWDESKPNGQPRRCVSTKKAMSYLGWQNKIDMDTGLDMTLEWYNNA